MTWKSHLLLYGGGLLATYLVTQPTLTPERTAPRTRGASRVPATVNIQEEADRLQTRVRNDLEYTRPFRNPFRFGSRPTVRQPPAPTREPAEEQSFAPQVVTPEPPPIRLSGVATDTVDGERQRTAILVTVQGVLTVREGDTVPPDYRVRRVEEDAIELEGGDGSTRRLKLRP